MPSGLGIEPLKTKKFHSKQSRYEHMPEVPFRGIFPGPGSSGYLAGDRETEKVTLPNAFKGRDTLMRETP